MLNRHEAWKVRTFGDFHCHAPFTEGVIVAGSRPSISPVSSLPTGLLNMMSTKALFSLSNLTSTTDTSPADGRSAAFSGASPGSLPLKRKNPITRAISTRSAMAIFFGSLYCGFPALSGWLSIIYPLNIFDGGIRNYRYLRTFPE